MYKDFGTEAQNPKNRDSERRLQAALTKGRLQAPLNRPRPLERDPMKQQQIEEEQSEAAIRMA